MRKATKAMDMMRDRKEGMFSVIGSRLKDRSRAFTLVESMVAIAILSSAITGPLLIAQKGIGSAIYSRDQITAFYLAQEAIEYIRNVRDTNRIMEQWWLTQFCVPPLNSPTESCTLNRTYKIDSKFLTFYDTSNPLLPNANAISTCSSTCDPLKYDSVSNLYTYAAGDTTMFTRTISIDNTVKSNEALVSVTISWKTKLFQPERSFTIREHLFDF